MTRRRPRVESALAAAAAAVGLVSIVSAVTPSFGRRIDLVEWMLPVWAPRIATAAAFLLGLLLLRLAPALARGRRSAWQLTVAISASAAAAHLAKGLDFEESSASLVLLAALLRYRASFCIRSAASGRRLVPTVSALAATCAALLAFGFRLPVPDLVEDTVAGLALLLAGRAVLLWVRPLGHTVKQTAAERLQAARLVRLHGRDSLSFFSLRRDKSWYFAPDGRAFLSYRVIGGVALVSGDPVGDPAAIEGLLEDFAAHAFANGWRLAVAAAGEELLPVYAKLGLRAFPLGREAVLRPAEFSLEGRRVRKVRQSVHRSHRAGYAVRILEAASADTGTREAVVQLAAAARGAWPERGFTMALDDLFAPDTVLALAEGVDGRPGAFVHLVPSGRGYSLSSMRRARGTVNGLMEFLIAETAAWGRERGVAEISLNFCVFADVLVAARGAHGLRAARWGLLRLDALFQLERLRAFSAKFDPVWRPRYVLYERVSDMPLIGLAYLRAESLLAPPRPGPLAA
jgi:lysyl-tRNA synthetase class 2